MIPSLSIGPRTLLNDCNHSAAAIFWRSAIRSVTLPSRALEEPRCPLRPNTSCRTGASEEVGSTRDFRVISRDITGIFLVGTQPHAVAWSHREPHGATCSHMQPHGATCSHMQPYATTRSFAIRYHKNAHTPMPTSGASGVSRTPAQAPLPPATRALTPLASKECGVVLHASNMRR